MKQWQNDSTLVSKKTKFKEPLTRVQSEPQEIKDQSIGRERGGGGEGGGGRMHRYVFMYVYVFYVTHICVYVCLYVPMCICIHMDVRIYV